ncbi:MAG TPA: DUF4911 domain-containing protein [Geobacteraceae bacterium]
MIVPAVTRYFRVDRRDLIYLKSILEAYEGMSTLSTVERQGCIVQLTVPAPFVTDMDCLLDALAQEITLAELPPPAVGQATEEQ